MEIPISPEQINILLVDDRPENIAALETTLAPLGHTLVSVNSGEAALREMLLRDYAVIILDILMPGMDGYETANLIKARVKSQYIPIIFVTASGEEPVKSYRVGAVDYMSVPTNPEILRAKVNAFVELYKAKRELASSKMELEKARYGLELRVLERTKSLTKEIEERIKTEAALLASENKFRSIFESSNDAVMLLTKDGFFDCNNKTLEVFGFSSREEAIKIHPADISPPFQPDGRDSFSASNEKIETALSRGVNHFEWMHRRRNGEDFPADILLSAFEHGGKKVLQATVRDVTERKKWEHDLIEANQKLQQALEDIKNTQKMLIRQEKLAAMGQLSAGVGHELKNPLNIIYSYIQLMMTEQGLQAEAAEGCKVIMEQVMRAVKIIDNLRDFARERKPEIKKIDLCPLIKKTLSLVEYEMKGEGIEIAQEFPSETVRVMGDEDQLAQVFLNITNNARDSMNMRKKSYSFDEMRRIGWRANFVVRTLVKGGKVNIRFEDTGVGISEEDKKKLFTPFFTTKGETTGTGLGIAIALGIIENHGGTIEFESEEGKGAVFEVTLPIAE